MPDVLRLAAEKWSKICEIEKEDYNKMAEAEKL